MINRIVSIQQKEEVSHDYNWYIKLANRKR